MPDTSLEPLFRDLCTRITDKMFKNPMLLKMTKLLFNTIKYLILYI